MLKQNLLISFLLRSLRKSTEKLLELSTRLLNRVLFLTLQLLVSSTSTSTQTEDGLLRSSKDFYSRLREMLTQSHKELVVERVTSSFVLLMLLLHLQWQVFLITPLHLMLTLMLMTQAIHLLVFYKVSIESTSTHMLLT